MVWWQIWMPSLARTPLIWRGDQFSSIIICSIRHHKRSSLRWLGKVLCLRFWHFSWATQKTYWLSRLALRLTSRVMVEGWTQIYSVYPPSVARGEPFAGGFSLPPCIFRVFSLFLGGYTLTFIFICVFQKKAVPLQRRDDKPMISRG